MHSLLKIRSASPIQPPIPRKRLKVVPHSESPEDPLKIVSPKEQKQTILSRRFFEPDMKKERLIPELRIEIPQSDSYERFLSSLNKTFDYNYDNETASFRAVCSPSPINKINNYLRDKEDADTPRPLTFFDMFMDFI